MPIRDIPFWAKNKKQPGNQTDCRAVCCLCLRINFDFACFHPRNKVVLAAEIVDKLKTKEFSLGGSVELDVLPCEFLFKVDGFDKLPVNRIDVVILAAEL